MNEHICEKLTLDTACKRLYISKPQLFRIFKKATGTTRWQYIMVKRLVAARKLLREGAKSTVVYS